MKTKSPWILHVLEYAKKNGLKYNEALRDPNLKVGYVKVERVKKSKEPKMEPMMKVKKERKKEAVMVVMEAPKMMIQTESGDLQQVVEAPKKVRAKRQAKKKEAVMM